LCPPPLRDVPRNDEPFGESDEAEEGEAQHRQQEDAAESEIWAHVAGDDLDVEAEALVAADEFGDCRTDRRIDAGIFEAHEALRNRRWPAHFEEGTHWACATRIDEPRQLLGQRAEGQN